MLAGAPSAFVNADVALDGEPVIGSFTVDGLTFAVTEGSNVELVGVAEAAAAGSLPATSESQGASAPDALLGFGSVPAVSEAEVGEPALLLPGFVTYGDAEYSVASIGAYAFYLSGVTSVELPVSVTDIDERAFRSSDVASVTVIDDNLAYSSFDGVLYDVGQSSLLLIPEGRLGAVRMPSTVMAALPSAFSHCAGVDAITVDADGAAFASENGLLYDASLETLLRVPAGATDITIREGCTTIAAGAMEGCAKLSTINAPASVTSISPDVFTSVPTVSLPAASVADDAEELFQTEKGEEADGAEGEEGTSPSTEAANSASTQLTALVALSSTDDDLPEVDLSAIEVIVPPAANEEAWRPVGFSNLRAAEEAVQLNSAQTYSAGSYTVTVDPYWHSLYQRNGIWDDVSNTRKELTWEGNTPSSGVMTIYDVAWFSSYADFLGLNSPGAGGLHNFIWFSSGTPGWTLKGFRENAGSNQLIQTDAEGLTCNRHFVALWEANKYTIAFDVNGGKNEANNKPANVTATFDSALPGINANKPKRDGYTFAGWYDTNAATGGTQYYDANNKAVSDKTWDKAKNTTLYARWVANSYTVEYWNKTGGTKLSSDTGFKYDTARTLAAKPTTGVSTGYTAAGWATSTNQSEATYSFSSSQKNLATSGTKKLYLAETPNTYTVRYNDWKGDKSILAADTGWVYDESRKLAAKPSSGVRTGYAAVGWATSAGQSEANYDFGSNQKNLATGGTKTLYLAEEPIEYSISYDFGGGTDPSGSRSAYTIESDSFSLGAPVRTGYVFDGWSVTGAQGAGLTTEGKVTTVKKGTFGNLACTAQWEPAISADVPLDVTAKVDLLGLEEQQEAAGYIESRCGEPLTVASIELSPLAGASELFGADNVADVAMEVLTAGATSPAARFALNASASQAPTTSAVFRMASYGTRVLISYRFDIPDELLPSLVETTKPVCQVAYTVALA